MVRFQRRRVRFQRRPRRRMRRRTWKQKKRLTTRRLRSGSKHFTRLHFNDFIRSPDSGGQFQEYRNFRLNQFTGASTFRQQWQYYKIHKIVVTYTPGANVTTMSDINATANGQSETNKHCICAVKEDVNTSSLTYTSVMALPYAKSARGTQKLTVSFKPTVGQPVDILGPDGVSKPLTNYVSAAIRTSPKLVCRNSGGDIDHLGCIYVNNGAVQAGIHTQVEMDAYAYVTFYKYVTPSFNAG